MKKTLLIVIVLVMLLTQVLLTGTVLTTEAGGCPTADRIILVIPEKQDGWAPDCDGIRGCVVACFLLPETRGEWEMSCFPWVPGTK